jgi:REP element-mobilizing transposase RayT
MMLNEFGTIVQQEILNIPKIRKQVMIDSFVVMPNHVHLLLCIDTPRSDPSKGALHAPLSSQPGALK